MTLTPNEWPAALKRLVELWAEHESKKRGRTVRPGGLAQRVLSPAYGRFYHSLSVGRSMTSRTAEMVWRELSVRWPEDLRWPSEIPRWEKREKHE